MALKPARIVRGGVTIPAKVRAKLGWKNGDLVGFQVVDRVLVIRRVRIVPVTSEEVQDESGIGTDAGPAGAGER